MKRWIWIPTIMMAAAVTLPAQQGRGGPPLAFGDQDKDGICDVKGEPVGQARAAMLKSGQRGWGRSGNWGPGRGRGFRAANWQPGWGRGGRGQGVRRQGLQPQAQTQTPRDNPTDTESK